MGDLAAYLLTRMSADPSPGRNIPCGLCCYVGGWASEAKTQSGPIPRRCYSVVEWGWGTWLHVFSQECKLTLPLPRTFLVGCVVTWHVGHQRLQPQSDPTARKVCSVVAVVGARGCISSHSRASLPSLICTKILCGMVRDLGGWPSGVKAPEWPRHHLDVLFP